MRVRLMPVHNPLMIKAQSYELAVGHTDKIGANFRRNAAGCQIIREHMAW